MESIKELNELIRKLKIENENLEDRVSRLEENRIANESKVKEAEQILFMIPKESSTRQMFEEFTASREELKVEEYISNKGLNKIFSSTDKFSIDDANNIYLGNLHIGTVTDDRFKHFLNKTVKLLPFLVRLYSRYLHYTELCSTINEYNYFGKQIFQRMENFKGKE